MISLLRRLFLDNWQRKLLSLILATALWLIVHASMIESKTVGNISVRVINLAQNETLEGMQLDGTLNRKVNMTFIGHRGLLADLSGKDLEIVLDAHNKPTSWTSLVGKQHLHALNKEFNLTKSIYHISPLELSLKKTKKVKEKIPVLITRPIGEAPKGYQFLDIWPYQLSLQVEGPEEGIKRLKTRGLKLTFNLNDISRVELETLEKQKKMEGTEEISFFVPNAWKKISIPFLSDFPLSIDDPLTKQLRIDFIRRDLLPIEKPLPVTICYLPKYAKKINPLTHTLMNNEVVKEKHGIKFLDIPLYAQGVSELFWNLVKDRIQLAILTAPSAQKNSLLWNAQVLYPHELEDRYVAKLMSESLEELGDIQPHMREDYLRNRFRNYMTRFRLYTPDGKKLSLQIGVEGPNITVLPQPYKAP